MKVLQQGLRAELLPTTSNVKPTTQPHQAQRINNQRQLTCATVVHVLGSGCLQALQGYQAHAYTGQNNQLQQDIGDVWCLYVSCKVPVVEGQKERSKCLSVSGHQFKRWITCLSSTPSATGGGNQQNALNTQK